MASSLTSTAGTVAASSTAKAKNTSDRATIAGNFDAFLSLLTTQLRNQNPLEPLNSNEFTQQLVQFSSVEQQLKTNDTLKELVSSSRTTSITNAATFVGSTITADGAATRLTSGSATWRLNAPRPVQATISVRDANGATVYSERKVLTTGLQDFRWNGRNSTGGFSPDGNYSIRVDATDATGQLAVVKTEIAGMVDGVDLTGASPVLLVGTARVAIDAVKSIRR
jgi:flagellar basal-body rod modification protein FlgD